MKKIFPIFNIVLLLVAGIACAGAGVETFPQIIATVLDDQADSIAFISTEQLAHKSTTRFLSNFNSLYMRYDDKMMPLGVEKDPLLVFNLPPKHFLR